MSTTTSENIQQLIKLIQGALEQDTVLREKYQVGERFRFVRDRLGVLLEQLERDLPKRSSKQQQAVQELQENEVAVYVYLYNSRGQQFKTWQGLVNPKVFYEYSVNRPIYGEKSHIEALLRSKTNKAQHAYLTVAVKKDQVRSGEDAPKDAVGNTVVKVKEGALRFERLIEFTHNSQHYLLNDQGLLIKKP